MRGHRTEAGQRLAVLAPQRGERAAVRAGGPALALSARSAAAARRRAARAVRLGGGGQAGCPPGCTTPKAAPCGSATTAKGPPGDSVGSMITLPPSSRTRAAAAAVFPTAK